jgi:hypothetical protein
MLAPAPHVAAPEAPSTREGDVLVLRPISEFPEGGFSNDAGQSIAEWVRSYLMRPHPDLGLIGAVCPYTAVAAKLGLAKVGVSAARDEQAVFAVMREAVAAFEAIDCPRAHMQFRTVIVGFPHSASGEGRAILKRVQNRLRPESTRRGKMIGLFTPDSPDAGLLNPNFRPLRSPIPLLAIRPLVENDAPFVLRNPRLAPIYLLKFPFAGMRKLMKSLWR